MPNTKLRGKGYYLHVDDTRVLKHLKDTINNYNQAGLSKRVEGYLSTVKTIESGNMSWDKLNHLIKHMDTLRPLIQNGSATEEQQNEYKVSGGEIFHRWLTDKMNHEKEITKQQQKMKQELPTTEKVLLTGDQVKYLIEKKLTSDIQEVITKYNQLRDTNYYPIKKLGEGLNGEAWQVSDSKTFTSVVFKLTEAPDEAWTSATLIDKNTKHFTKIHDVVEYERNYIIVQDMIQTKLPPKFKSEDIDLVLDFLRKYHFETISKIKFMTELREKIYRGNKQFSRELEIIIDMIFEIIHEGRSLGFKNLDINPNNLGYQNGRIVLFDIMDYTQGRVGLSKIV